MIGKNQLNRLYGCRGWRGRGVGVEIGVAPGVAVRVAIGMGVGVEVGVAPGVVVGLAVGVGVGVAHATRRRLVNKTVARAYTKVFSSVSSFPYLVSSSCLLLYLKFCLHRHALLTDLLAYIALFLIVQRFHASRSRRFLDKTEKIRLSTFVLDLAYL